MFENVLGHVNIKKRLEEQILTGQVSHAYIFYGKEGIGKEKLAEEFAKELLKTKNLLTSPDYKYIKKPEDKKELPIKQMRKEVIEEINIAPVASNYKVYIIGEGDLLNEETQNAMLKILEDPPSYVVIVIVAKKINSFLPTVVSRTNNVFFDKLSDEDIIKIVGNEDVTKEILQESDGSANKAIRLISSDLAEEYIKSKSLVEAINKKQLIDVMLKLSDISFKKADMEYVQNLLLESKNYIAVRYIEEAKIVLEKNANEDVVKTSLAIKLCK